MIKCFICVLSANTDNNAFDFDESSKPEHLQSKDDETIKVDDETIKVNDEATKAIEITVILKREGSITEGTEL